MLVEEIASVSVLNANNLIYNKYRVASLPMDLFTLGVLISLAKQKHHDFYHSAYAWLSICTKLEPS